MLPWLPLISKTEAVADLTDCDRGGFCHMNAD
jgi:hypothetical protein